MRSAVALVALLAFGGAIPTDYSYEGQPQTSPGSGLLNLFSGGCDSATGIGCGSSGDSSTSSIDGGFIDNGGFAPSGCDLSTGIGCGGSTSSGCDLSTGIGCGGSSGSGCDLSTGIGCGGNDVSNAIGDSTGTTSFGSGSGIINNGLGVGGGAGGAINCPQDRTIFQGRDSTIVQQVTRTVNVPQVSTTFITSTAIVPQVNERTVVSTDVVQSTVLNTRVQTVTRQQQVVSTVRLPDTFNTRFQTVRSTNVQVRQQTQTRLVTRSRVVPQVSVVYRTQVVDSVVSVPQLQVRTSFVQVPGPGRTIYTTITNNREQISYYQPPARTVVQTSTAYRTEIVSVPVRQPDTVVTVSSVSVVPVTSVVLNTRFEPQVVTNVVTVSRTVTKTEATTSLVQQRSQVVRQVLRTDFNTVYVTNTQQVVQTRVQDSVQTVRVPGQPQVIVQTEQLVQTRTVPGPDTFQTRFITVSVPREVLVTKTVEQRQVQEKVVTETRGGGYCAGGAVGGHHSGGGHYGYKK